MRVVVLHRGFGCDTGCCGHVVEVDGKEVGGFEFSHPEVDDEESKKSFARDMIERELGADHIKDLDWENSYIAYD
jgi:hypothetical protein